MSLNNTKYLRPLPSSYLVQPRIAARFQSLSLQQQIDKLREDVHLLFDAVLKLIDMNGKEQQDMQNIDNSLDNVQNIMKQYRAFYS